MEKYTSENFGTEVLKSEVPVLVDFYADWCGPCKKMGPVVEQLAAEYEGRMIVGRINVEEAGDIAIRYHVMSIPALLLFKGGELKLREVGVQSMKVLKKKLDEAL